MRAIGIVSVTHDMRLPYGSLRPRRSGDSIALASPGVLPAAYPPATALAGGWRSIRVSPRRRTAGWEAMAMQSKSAPSETNVCTGCTPSYIFSTCARISSKAAWSRTFTPGRPA